MKSVIALDCKYPCARPITVPPHRTLLQITLSGEIQLCAQCRLESSHTRSGGGSTYQGIQHHWSTLTQIDMVTLQLRLLGGLIGVLLLQLKHKEVEFRVEVMSGGEYEKDLDQLFIPFSKSPSWTSSRIHDLPIDKS